MALRGQASKLILQQQILDKFPGSFISGKDIRIPMTEDGETVEIKISMTAAKDVLGGGAPVTAPDMVPISNLKITPKEDPADVPWGRELPDMNALGPKPNAAKEPSDEEKANLAKIMSALGLN